MPAWGSLPKFLRGRKRRIARRKTLRTVKVGSKFYTVRPPSKPRRRR